MADAPKPDQDKSAETMEDETEEDGSRAAVMEVPAIYVDTYWITYWPDRIRIAFGEKFRAGKLHVRSAVTMPMETADSLIASLVEIQEEIKEKKKKKE